jgi:hypothetical protein
VTDLNACEQAGEFVIEQPAPHVTAIWSASSLLCWLVVVANSLSFPAGPYQTRTSSRLAEGLLLVDFVAEVCE